MHGFLDRAEALVERIADAIPEADVSYNDDWCSGVAIFVRYPESSPAQIIARGMSELVGITRPEIDAYLGSG